MQEHSQKKLLIISGLFFVLSIGAFYLLYKQINSSNEKADAVFKEWKSEAERRNKLNSLDNLVKKIDPDRVELESHFAKSSDVVPFLDTLDSLGSLAGVKSSVSSLDILSDKSGLSVEVRATGGFDSIYRFLLLLENSQYELHFTSMSMQIEAEPNGGGVSGPPIWNATFKVKLTSFIL